MTVRHLSTSRVLVVDDSPEEALPILEALGRIGVGCVFVRGDVESNLPRKPIQGIRLVFLDMRLDDGGNQKSVLSKTLGVLKRCVPATAMPLVVVCWTKHPDDVDVFRRMAVEDMPGLQSDLIVAMEKPTGRPEHWRDLRHAIDQALEQYNAVSMLWQWENVLHGAATDVSQTLAELASRVCTDENASSTDWQEGVFAVCRELVRAEMGKTADEATSSAALFRMMNELGSDRIQHAALDVSLTCAAHIIPRQEKNALPSACVSHLNGMLLVDPVHKDDVLCAPGTILLSRQSRFAKPFREALGIRWKELTADLLDDSSLQKMTKRASALEARASSANADDACHAELAELRRRMAGFPRKFFVPCRTLLVEISPSCDFVQKKRPVPRYLAGLAIPENLSKYLLLKSQGPSIHVLGPVSIPHRMPGGWILLLNSRHVYSGGSVKDRDFPPAACRLRSGVLADIRTWVAFQSARAGATSIR